MKVNLKSWLNRVNKDLPTLFLQGLEQVKQFPKKYWFFLVALLSFFVLIIVFANYTTKGGVDDIKSFIDQLETTIIVGPKKLPEVEQYQISSYEAQRDPFSVFEIASDLTQEVLIKTGLEAYDINLLKLTGVLGLGDQYFGVIEAPDGKIYRVEPGDKIGHNEGMVLNIDASEMVILETIYKQGKKTRRVIFMKLGEGESE